MFQFHEGPIKTAGAGAGNAPQKGFNSMKVRLKHEYVHSCCIRAFKFQFHEGPIKTCVRFCAK